MSLLVPCISALADDKGQSHEKFSFEEMVKVAQMLDSFLKVDPFGLYLLQQMF